MDWVKVVFGGVTSVKELVITACLGGGVVSPSACVCSLMAGIFVYLGEIVILRTRFFPRRRQTVNTVSGHLELEYSQ